MGKRRKYGFTVTELMVVVGITGIIATIAMPRYKSFLVSSRRREAKGHLNIIHALQTSYKAEHGQYYGGFEVGYSNINGISCDDVDHSDKELDNKLGFRPNDCVTLRYSYYTDSAGGGKAHAPSNADKRWIYPDCSGPGCNECGEELGDKLQMTTDGDPQVCRNITKYCPDGGGCNAPCTCHWVTGPWEPDPSTVLVCETFNQTAQETWTCSGNPPCPSPLGGNPTRTSSPRTGVPGTKPIDASTPTTRPPGCPCCYVMPDPREGGACHCIPCNCTDTVTWSPSNPVTWANAHYWCDQQPFTKTTTRTCTSSPPRCDRAPITETKHVNGNKSVPCDTSCPWDPWGPWSGCMEVSPGPPPVCENRRTRYRSCPTALPCPTNCPMSDQEVQRCNCTVPVDMCTHDASMPPRGLVGETIEFAKAICDNNSETLSWTEDHPNTGDITCDCIGAAVCDSMQSHSDLRGKTVGNAEDYCEQDLGGRFSSLLINPPGTHYDCQCQASMCPHSSQFPNPPGTTITAARSQCAGNLALTGTTLVEGTHFDHVTCKCSPPSYVYVNCLMTAFTGQSIACSAPNPPCSGGGANTDHLQTLYNDLIAGVNGPPVDAIRACVAGGSCSEDVIRDFLDVSKWGSVDTTKLKDLQSGLVALYSLLDNSLKLVCGTASGGIPCAFGVPGCYEIPTNLQP